MHGAGPADEEKVAGLTKALAGRLQTYDVILGKQKYLAGDELSIADLFHLCVPHPHVISLILLPS